MLNLNKLVYRQYRFGPRKQFSFDILKAHHSYATCTCTQHSSPLLGQACRKIVQLQFKGPTQSTSFLYFKSVLFSNFIRLWSTLKDVRGRLLLEGPKASV